MLKEAHKADIWNLECLHTFFSFFEQINYSVLGVVLLYAEQGVVVGVLRLRGSDHRLTQLLCHSSFLVGHCCNLEKEISFLWDQRSNDLVLHPGTVLEDSFGTVTRLRPGKATNELALVDVEKADKFGVHVCAHNYAAWLIVDQVDRPVFILGVGSEFDIVLISA